MVTKREPTRGRHHIFIGGFKPFIYLCKSTASSSFYRGRCEVRSFCVDAYNGFNGKTYCFILVLLFHLLSVPLLAIRPQQLFLEKKGSHMYSVTLWLFSNLGIFQNLFFFSCRGFSDVKYNMPDYNTSGVLATAL